jgi:hypothetical protein
MTCHISAEHRAAVTEQTGVIPRGGSGPSPSGLVRRLVGFSGGNTSFEPFPKSSAGRRVVPLPSWLVELIREHRDHYPAGDRGLGFPNSVGKPLRRTLFRSRIWRPTLVRAGLLATLVSVQKTTRAEWVDSDGPPMSKEFNREHEVVAHLATHAGEALSLL